MPDTDPYPSKMQIRDRLRPLSPLPTGARKKGGKLPPIRCVLFDVYGTLFISASGDIGVAGDSEPWQQQLKDLLARTNIDLKPAELWERYVRAIEADHRSSKSVGIAYPEVDIIRIWEKVLESRSVEQVREFAVEFEILTNPTYPMPNLSDVLTACRKSNIRMGLISNAQFYTPLLFKWFLHADTEDLGFDTRLVFYSYRHGHAKPGSHLFRLAVEQLRQMKIATAEVLYVGNDMLNDIYPAKQAGFLTALFAGDGRSLRRRADDPRCSELTPDLVVTDLSQLIPYLPNPSS